MSRLSSPSSSVLCDHYDHYDYDDSYPTDYTSGCCGGGIDDGTLDLC